LAGTCGAAAKTYLAYDTNFSGGLCATGSVRTPSPTFPANGSSVSWWCDGVYGGTNAQCTASRNNLSTYELWVYRNRCSGNRSDTIDIVEASSLPINWRPDVSRINMATINGQTLCYEVRQNCSATNVKILGQQNKTYDCSVPNRLGIQPSTVDISTNTDQVLSTNVICSKGETLPVQRDLTPANSINWGGSYSTIVTCSPGTTTTYQSSDNYNLRSGNGLTVCTGNVTGTVSNYIYNGFGWGNMQGNYNLNIRRGITSVGGDCPACGTKYMDVQVQVPLMQCVPTANVNLSLSAVPASVNSGSSSTLTWVVSNATSCTASSSPANAQWIGSKSASDGSHTQAVTGITQLTTFTLVCSGLNSVTRSATVSINTPSATLTLSASPTSINAGNNSTLTWVVANATSCTASSSPANAQWTGNKSATAGSHTQVISGITARTTFTLVCSGTNSVSRNVTVSTVTQPCGQACTANSNCTTGKCYLSKCVAKFYQVQTYNASHDYTFSVCLDSPQRLVFQVNDGQIWDNTGSYTVYTCANGSCATPETLVVDFKTNNSDPWAPSTANGKWTANNYNGCMMVRVTGTGQANGAAYSDAFYVYNPAPPTHALGSCWYTLLINGKCPESC
jgi:hypothetical protein